MSSAQTVQRTSVVLAADGRELRVWDAGEPSWPVVIHHHGSPSCGLLPPEVLEAAAARELRIVSYDRPGYGESTRLPGRLMAHAAADVAAIADQLGIERFATMGVSGGGSHTLACAALLSDRVVACACVSGAAPFDAEGLDYFAGMGEMNAEEINIIKQGSEAHIAWLREFDNEMRSATPEQLREQMHTLLSPVDRDALTDKVAEYLHASFVEATKAGVEGWSDESFAGYEPWGFDLTTIGVPTSVWHGGQDRFVPVTHGRWVAERIPGCDLHIHEELGHISLIVGLTGEIHAWLADRL